MNPGDQTPLETTIGYEQVAVDLTSWLARHEPDPMLKQALDFALLEDFDHLYRYANLYELLDGKNATDLTDQLTEITPGRPTIVEHRHPHDDVRGHYDTHTVDPLSRMHVMTIVAAEQQTMNFYMNHGADWIEPIARGLYAEIALIEEQHVTHYESLLDPLDSWLKQLVFHEYNEAYLYWSMLQNEEDRRIKSIWELHLDMEIGQLHAACDLLRRYEGIEPEEILPEALPDTPVTFEPNKEYVREILATQIDLARRRPGLCPGRARLPASTGPGATARWSTPAASPAKWSSTTTAPTAAMNSGTRPRENTRWSSCGPDPSRLNEEERDGCHGAGYFTRIKPTNNHERRRTGGRRPAAADLSAGSLRRLDGRTGPGAALPARQPRPRTAPGRSRT